MPDTPPTALIATSDPRFVPCDGPADASIVILGEAPGKNEDLAHRPFVGWSGNKLFKEILPRAGIQRSSCLVGNVIPVKPPNNKFQHLYSIGVDPDLEAERCREWVNAHPRDLVICLGNEAMNCILGYSGVLKYRGSLITKHVSGLLYDVYIMVHPAFIAKDWCYDSICKADGSKLKRYLDPNYDDQPKDIYIYGKQIRRSLRTRSEMPAPTSCEHFLRFIHSAKRAEILAFDIETFESTITVFGLSIEAGSAISIPFTGQFTEPEEALLIEAIRDLLDQPMPKVSQNGIYDCTYLADQWGVSVRGHVWDTMLMHHCIYSELPHGLDFLVSVYTDVPYFKAMAKEAEDANYANTHWEYNALDVACTLEIQPKLATEITTYKQWAVYWEYYTPLSAALANMQRRGLAFDCERREVLIDKLEAEITTANDKLAVIVGEKFNIKSPTQMKSYVHGVLNLPKQTKRAGKTRVFTLDKTARATLRRKYPVHTEFFDLVDLASKNRDLMSKYLGKTATGKRTYIEDPDGRIRTSFNIAGNSRTDDQEGGAETGRLSSSKNCYGRGCNMQNQPKSLRDLYIPDPGYVMWQADWQSAESYVVGWLSGDQAMMEILTNHRLYKEGGPEKVMMHEAIGAIASGLPQEQIIGKWREFAKRCGHARNYGVSPAKLAEQMNNLLPEIPFTVMNARRVMIDLDNTFWGIKDWKTKTRMTVAKTRKLYNIFGHMRIFFGRVDDSLFREAYAHVPQSSVGVGLNRALVLVEEQLAGRDDICTFITVHDSIVGQCVPSALEETHTIVSEILERPLPCTQAGMQLRIPASFSSGSNWKECG